MIPLEIVARILSRRREYSLLSVLKAGEVNEAIERLSRSPRWVSAAIDPVSKLWLALDLGERKLGMEQRLVHQVVAVLEPDCVTLCLTE